MSAFLLSFIPAVHAQLFRTYVSSAGSDANPCTIVQPCRLLPAAINAVAAGGEIWMLDSANYNTGPVVITKSVSILAIPGAVGSVLGIGGAVAISVEQAGTKVALRNLRISSMTGSPNSHGVVASGPVRLVIEGGVITGFRDSGVYASAQAQLRMSGTIVRDVLFDAIRVEDGADAILTRVVLANNGAGVQASSTSTANPTRIAIIGSTIERNAGGVVVFSPAAGGVVSASITGSLISGNQTGLSVDGDGPSTLVAHGNTITGNEVGMVAGGTVAAGFLGSNLVTGNTIGLQQAGTGTFASLGTNTLRGNTTAKSGPIDPATPD